MSTKTTGLHVFCLFQMPGASAEKSPLPDFGDVLVNRVVSGCILEGTMWNIMVLGPLSMISREAPPSDRGMVDTCHFCQGLLSCGKGGLTYMLGNLSKKRGRGFV